LLVEFWLGHIPVSNDNSTEIPGGGAMSDRRRFLKGLTSLPLATVLANPRLAAAVSAGLQEVEAKLSSGKTVKAAIARPKGQAKGSILLIHEWWGLV
jgi:carboxymethylenebutenolidase